MLTIAIGPEHHDIRLLDYKRSNVIIGRISFNVACFHIENITLDIKNIQFKVFHLVQNEVVMKLKFRDTQHSIETNYTDPILPTRLNKEEVTIYNWIEPEETDKSKLALQLQLSMMELRSSNSSINIYDIRMVDIENTLNSTPSNINLTSLETINLHSPAIVEKTKKIQTEVGVLDNKLHIQNKNDLILKPKYTLIGYANLNFYEILSENDNTITKQSSRFFQTFFSGNENYNGINSGPKMITRSDNGFYSTNNESNNGTKNASETPEQNLLRFQIFDDISKPFVEELYFNGTVIGKIEGTIVIKNMPLIRQIMCGVHTETGFDISSIHLNVKNNLNLNTNSYSKDQETIPPELKVLSNQTNNFLSNLLKATNLTQFTQSSRELNLQILQIMNEIKLTLKISSKESALYYNYLNNKDLYKAQKIMLELGINILNMIESFNLEQRTVGFEILILINNRAEFDLGTLWRAWFQDFTQTTSVNTNFRDNSLITDKIIESFITFNNICLEFVLERLSRGKWVDKESKTFVEFFLSVAYFRIPKFRNAFLEIVSKNLTNDDKKEAYEIEKGASSVDDFLNIDPVNSLILWENLFYKRLTTALQNTGIENEIQDRLNETDKILNKENVQTGSLVMGYTNTVSQTNQFSTNKSDWKDRLAKRGLAFFSIINRLEKYILNKVVKNIDIKWYNIPGFDIIINTIIHELKLREVAKYPAQLIELLTIFFNDSDLVNIFFRTIVTRTK